MRIKQWIYITNLVIGLGARDDAAAVVFATCCRQGDDIDNGQCGLGFHLIGDEVPRVTGVTGTSSDGLRAVEHRAAAHSKDNVDVVLLAEANAVQNAGVILRVGLYAAEFHDFVAFQQFQHFLVKADCFDASATVGEKDFLSELRNHFGQFLHNALAENEARRGLVIKVLHNDIFLLFINNLSFPATSPPSPCRCALHGRRC